MDQLIAMPSYIEPIHLPVLPSINLDRERCLVVHPPGRRLIPTPPPSPLPVSQDILDVDMDDHETEASKHDDTNLRKRKETGNND